MFFFVNESAVRKRWCIRILLDGNTGGGVVTLRPIRFHCVGVRISTGPRSTVHRYRVDHMYAQL